MEKHGIPPLDVAFAKRSAYHDGHPSAWRAELRSIGLLRWDR